jgi:dipeptidase
MTRPGTATWILLALLAALSLRDAEEVSACTSVMAGRNATRDGSVLMSSSCDGNQMGHIYVVPARQYPEGAALPMFRDKQGREAVGKLPPIQNTYRAVVFGAGALGGINEHGVSIGIEYIPTKPGLASTRGAVGPYSNHWTTSLIANGLLRARTAREAIRLIGALVEEHGLLYTWAPNAGVALPIIDKREAWLMEICGPGKDWTPGSGAPGGVWCAQRIPDGAVGVSANRSRIGRVDLDDTDHFMASSNLFSLARELGLWKEGDAFVWRDVYGTPGDRGAAMREWRALSLIAPSLDLKPGEDPVSERHPFAVEPDEPVTAASLMRLMRDGYEGTPFDVTEDPAFRVRGEKSPLARPWGPPELFRLLGVEPQRAINTPTSTFVFVAQSRQRLPAPLAGLAWFAYGPASTSCFVPIYAGATELPESWVRPPNWSKIDRRQAQWNYRLVHNLANNLKYQEVMEDVREFIEAAESQFLEVQPELEAAATDVFKREGRERAEAFVTRYTADCLTQVGRAYHELVDYLMFKHLYDRADIAPQPFSPTIPRPAIPDCVFPAR